MIRDKFYDDEIWALKYRPRKIEGIITSEGIKNQLKKIIDSGQVPNMLFYGGAGTGKTTAATLIADILDRETHYINGSFETGIDVLRTTIVQFVSSMSIEGGKKIVIIDEADRATPQLQDALKSFIEEFSKVANFIFISNHKNKIITPLQSRLQSISFDIPSEEINTLKKQFFTRCLQILKLENFVQFENNVVAQLVNQLFPDMRRILTELQKFAQQGKLTALEHINFENQDVKKFFELLKEKDYVELRKYISGINDPQKFYSLLNTCSYSYVKTNTILQFGVLLSKYSYEAAFVLDPQVNLAGFINECLLQAVEVK